MYAIDEDVPVNSLHSISNEDNEEGDEAVDFRFLANLNAKTGSLPKRGEKDFESHGTKHQDGVLAASRQAMHDALDFTRTHIPKTYVRAFYYGEGGLQRDDVVKEEWRQGLDDDHVVVVETNRGPYFKTMGRSSAGKPQSSIWLLPEEALYLVERGSLDLWWPTESSFNGMFGEDASSKKEQAEDVDEGMPMSFQAAYALLIGQDGERGKVSLERYTVYSNLKRGGFVVIRAPEWDPLAPGKPHAYDTVSTAAVKSQGMISWLLSLFEKDADTTVAPYGPLVKPGLYRSYDSIYRQVAIIPRYDPSAIPKDVAAPPEHPYRVCFHVWKPASIPRFAKSNPGEPEIRIAVCDARSSSVPTLTQVASLLQSTPWDPPAANLVGPDKFYQRLRHGYRNVILAVNDHGVISYVRVGDAAFGQEPLYPDFDGGFKRGNKRVGGGGGRGGHHGRGRGRGGHK